MDAFIRALPIVVALTVVALAIVLWAYFEHSEARQKLKAEKQALKAELDQFADEAYAEQQRYEKADFAVPVALPMQAFHDVQALRSNIDTRLMFVRSSLQSTTDQLKHSKLSSARNELDHGKAQLVLVRGNIDTLVAIPGEVERQLRVAADAEISSVHYQPKKKGE
jgi:type III secretory pathway component EscV